MPIFVTALRKYSGVRMGMSWHYCDRKLLVTPFSKMCCTAVGQGLVSWDFELERAGFKSQPSL